MSVSPSSFSPLEATPWPGFEAFAPVEVHVGFTILFLLTGALIWLADGFIAERTDLGSDTEFDQFGLPNLDRERLGRDEVRNRYEATAQGVGKALVVVGAALAAGLALRLLF